MKNVVDGLRRASQRLEALFDEVYDRRTELAVPWYCTDAVDA